jgi:hypothetical protein
MPWVTINGAHILIGEDDGSGPDKTETTLGKAVLEMRLQDARGAVTEARAKGWHVNFEHAEPSTEPEKRAYAKAKVQGKTAIMFRHEPHAEVTERGDRTTHAYDEDQPAHTYPHPSKPGTWVSEQHMKGYTTDVKTFATREKALAASQRHATHGITNAHFDRGSRTISTDNVGKGVRNALVHHEMYHSVPESYQLHIKVLK